MSHRSHRKGDGAGIDSGRHLALDVEFIGENRFGPKIAAAA